MNVRYFKPEGTDLASRYSAAALRHEVEDALDRGQQVVLDLHEVLSISESYADELLGVLAFERGLRWFGRDVRVRAPQDILLAIAAAIRERLSDHARPELAGQIRTLLVAKRSRERLTA